MKWLHSKLDIAEQRLNESEYRCEKNHPKHGTKWWDILKKCEEENLYPQMHICRKQERLGINELKLLLKKLDKEKQSKYKEKGRK